MSMCPKCGAEVEETISGSSLTLTCSDCGWRVARSWTEPINEDETVYTLRLITGNKASKETLSAVSKIAGCNFLAAKDLIENPCKPLLKCKAPAMKKHVEALSEADVNFAIIPDFPY